MSHPSKIGIVGTGFIARGFARVVRLHAQDLELASVLTRRPPSSIKDHPFPELLTTSVQEFLDKVDLVVECSGDVLHATDVIDLALKAGKPVVTMDSEFHVTTGSYFADKGMLTEAEGDQPGCIAALREEALQMSFSPLVYGNMKGFLNHHPTPEEMAFWSGKQGISIEQTTSFTDGTKIQIEQAFVANGFGATITRQGMEGPKAENIHVTARELGQVAANLGTPIADYMLAPGQFAGVFVTATHDSAEQGGLAYLKMGDGPFYALFKTYHLCQYEIVKTVRRVLSGGGVLLNNSTRPTLSIASIAKTALTPGTAIKRAIGGFQVRGEAVKISEARGHVPIGLLQSAVVTRNIEPGQVISFDDVELPPTLALDIVQKLF